MEPFLISLSSVLIAAILGGIGYFLRMIFEKMDGIGKDIADIRHRVGKLEAKILS